MQIALIVVAALVVWTVCGITNHVFYHKLFQDAPHGMDTDLIIMLGPLGTVMLLLMAAMMGFTAGCKRLGDRLSGNHAG
jgi:hypothetical protein